LARCGQSSGVPVHLGSGCSCQLGGILPPKLEFDGGCGGRLAEMGCRGITNVAGGEDEKREHGRGGKAVPDVIAE